jgi:type I restriction enzyme, S subunit
MTMSLLLQHFDDLLITPENAEQLNRAILQLAVQGKLVLQDLQDEPAEILYKRILKEKEQNLNGRTPRSLPSVSQDEIPFEIPSNWVWTRLGEISNYGEATKSKAVQFTDETWVLDLEDIEKTTSRLIQRVRLKDRQFQSEKSVFQKGDVIYGKLRPYLDKVIVADEDGICSSELIPIKAYGNINPFYLRLTLKRPDFIDYVNGKTYGVKMPRLGTQDARMALVPLPPLAEQQRIVTRVEELFAQTRALAKELAYSQIELDGLNKSALSHLLASETPEEFDKYWTFISEHFDLLFQTPEHVTPLRQSILELAVRGKLTHREVSDGKVLLATDTNSISVSSKKRAGRLWGSGLVPELSDIERNRLPTGWIWAKVKELGQNPDETVQVGPMSMKSQDFEERGVPVLNVGCVQWGWINETKLDFMPEDKAANFERYRVKSGDVLFTRSGTIGRCAIAQDKHDGWLMTFHLLRVRPSRNKCISKYLQIVFEGASHIRRQAQEASIGSTRAGFNTNLLAMLDVPLPPLAEQERIVKRVEQLLSLCDALEARLQSAEEERGRLVAAVMSTVGG